MKFFQCLDNAVRIYDKMQVVLKEMICDGTKFNVVKQNLVGRIQVHHGINCLAFM